MRYLLIVISVCLTPALFAGDRIVPEVSNFVTKHHGQPIDGVAPLLVDLAALDADARPWIETGVAGGATVRGLDLDPQLLVEFNANGRYTVRVGDEPIGEAASFEHELKDQLVASYPGIEIVPTEATDMFRIWTRPALIPAFFAEVRAAVETCTLAPWHLPAAQNYGSLVTEGHYRIFTDYYENLSVRGTGVKVAIIDIGFQGIDSWAQAEVGSYSRLTSQPNLNSDWSPHGTGCAEIIKDVAPGCQIKVYRLDTQLDVTTATNDAVAWGADIISASLLWFETPGVGSACNAASYADQAGVYWVNAAGNYHNQNYWEESNPSFMTYNGGIYVDYDPPIQDPYQHINTAPGYQFSIRFAFEAPTASYARFQLQIWRWDGVSPTLTLVASGSAGATTQWVDYTAGSSTYSYSYYALIRQTQSGVVGPMRLFSPYDQLFFYSQQGSVGNPGSVSSVITVGAVNQATYHSSGTQPENYSSRGGGIWNLPLDWCAPTAVTCASYGAQGFTGTSAACPHMAGLLACQLSDPGLAVAPLNNLYVTDIGAAGWDVDSGLGVIWAFLDGYESDNTPATANPLGSASTTSINHNLSPGVEQDWYSFTTSGVRAVTLQTSGSVGGDTIVTLFDSSQQFYASADGGGTGDFSRLYIPNLPAGTWYARVEEDGNDAVIQNYSLALTINVNGPPAAPILTSPANGATGQPTNPNLVWNAAAGTGSITYQCQVASDAGFLAVVFDQSGLTGLNATPTGLTPGTTYWWRVRGSSQYGTGAWSLVRSFETAINLPGAPTLVSPSDQATGVSLNPTLSWVAPGSGSLPMTYDIEVALDAAFTQPAFLQSNHTTTTFALPALQQGTTYFWRVNASNAGGSGPWSAPFQFETQGGSGGSGSGGGGGDSGGGGCSTISNSTVCVFWIGMLAIGAFSLRRRMTTGT